MELESTPITNNVCDYYVMRPEIKKTFTCLLPEQSRQSTFVTIPTSITDQDALYSIFTQSIQLQYPNHKIYIMSIRCTQDELYKLEYGEEDSMHESKNHYNIIYLIIPKKLISQLESNGICRVGFYVSNSTDANEYKILDNPPLINMISTEDKKGKKLPFSLVANLS